PKPMRSSSASSACQVISSRSPASVVRNSYPTRRVASHPSSVIGGSSSAKSSSMVKPAASKRARRTARPSFSVSTGGMVQRNGAPGGDRVILSSGMRRVVLSVVFVVAAAAVARADEGEEDIALLERFAAIVDQNRSTCDKMAEELNRFFD